MTRGDILYLAPYLISLAITANVFAYAWTKRQAQGATAFAWFVFGQGLWITGFILELVSAEFSDKLFWENIQWFASAFVVALPVFAVEYAEYKLPRASAWFKASLIIPALFIVYLLLDPYLHWAYADAQVSSANTFMALNYRFTPPMYVYAIYGYILAFLGLAILFRGIIHPRGLYRAQVSIIAFGFFVPVLGSLLGALRFGIIGQLDTTPFSFAIGNFIIAWGLFRLRIFEVYPVVRDKVFEAMVEPVVILNNENLVVDINTSMLNLMGAIAQDVIGKPAKEVFADFFIPIRQYAQTTYAKTEATFDIGGKKVYYEMTVWPLRDAQKKITGRIYISHDVTAFKELEQDLLKLNAKLEDRVRARTRELAEAYDTTLEGWARTLEMRDKETEGHTRRVADMTLKIAARMKIAEADLDHVRRGAILHDIGKMGIPDKILLKPGKLTDEERAAMQEHAVMAYNLLKPIPFLRKALDIPYCHHEKWDGTGYPRGLKGEEIPLAARIFAVVDVWDAICSERPYKKAWTRKDSIAYFIEQSGKHFDPKVVNLFLEMLEKGEI